MFKRLKYILNLFKKQPNEYFAKRQQEHNFLKKQPITRTTWFHRTTEENWMKIQKEGILWGGDTFHKSNGKDGYRYTYLSSIDWGESYGSVLLKVNYQVTGLTGIDNARYDEDCEFFEMLETGKYNVNDLDQFSVFVPIPLCLCKRIK